MAQYIDKNDLVAKIERRKNYNQERAYLDRSSSMAGREEEDKDILSIIDSLNVEEVDLEKDVRQILSLYYEGIKYYEDIIKKEREENGGSDLAIKIMDGVVDARELGIQYVIDKLKARKGE